MRNVFQILIQRKMPAYSLVEIGIALVVVGLVIGGILKGQELVASARLNAVITQLNQYKLATNTFVDRYGALPGDFSQASTQISNTLKDGNGNGIIDGAGTSPADESVQFWLHLAASGLVSDVKPDALKSGESPLPLTKMGGHIAVAHAPLPELAGHWFIVGTPLAGGQIGGLLTPIEAQGLARKMDSPDPWHGTVQIRGGANATKGSCLTEGGQLNFETTHPVCVVYVKF